MIVAFSAVPVSAAETNLAAVASNELGLDLYRQAAKGDSNLCLAIDEKGMEAAAATAVSMGVAMAARPQEPLEIRVDRPFLFAIQHVPTGTCLFLGRVTDPR